jgi:hypothetical protein
VKNTENRIYFISVMRFTSVLSALFKRSLKVIAQRHHNLVTLSESRAFCPEGMPLARDESKY